MKKLIVMFMVLVMAMTLITGCGSKGTGKETGKETGQDGVADDETDVLDKTETAEYTIWLYADDYKGYYSSYDDNPVVTYLNEKFNIRLKFQQPPMGSESEALSTMLGTGEYTDVISAAYAPDQQKLFNDGVIIDLAPYVDKYMPNLKTFLENNPEYVKDFYDDEGRLLNLMNVNSEENHQWGGLVYRRDILDLMTGGNVTFPSGEDEPTTVADWEYALELYKHYFAAAADAGGMTEYAGLILPYNGFFTTGEIVSGFGVGGSYYLDADTVKYGPMEKGFYNYLVKMREWYEKGYIYQDFASRINDVFYLPNTALTYGGAAGMWFGLNSQLGDVMSMPEYDLYVNVQPMASPLDTEHNITSANVRQYLSNVSKTAGFLVTSKCQNIERLLEALDYLYSEEGAMVRSYGLTGEDAANNEIYQNIGLEEGSYTLEDGNFAYHPLVQSKEIDNGVLMADRLPGVNNLHYDKSVASDIVKYGHEVWAKYGEDGVYPSNASQTVEENDIYTANQTNIDDYVNSMVPKFIMGVEELTEESFAKFVDQLKNLGIEENVEIQQAAYDRYMSR